MGLRLFHRSTRALSLTEDGLALFHDLEDTVPNLVGLLSSRGNADEPSGRLIIGASTSFAQCILMPLVTAFAREYPAVKIELRLDDARTNVVADGVELAFRHGPLHDSAMYVQRFRSVRYGLMASQDYLNRNGIPRTPQDLDGHALATFTYPSFRTSWLFNAKTGRRAEHPIDPAFTATTAIALRGLAAAGSAITILPDWCVQDAKLISVLPGFTVTGRDTDPAVWMVRSSRCHVPKRVEAFINFARDRAPSHP